MKVENYCCILFVLYNRSNYPTTEVKSILLDVYAYYRLKFEQQKLEYDLENQNMTEEHSNAKRQTWKDARKITTDI